MFPTLVLFSTATHEEISICFKARGDLAKLASLSSVISGYDYATLI